MSQRIFALAIIFLSACAAFPSDVLPANSPNNAITLTLWHTQSGAAARLLDTFIADFRRANPSIRVVLEPKPNEGDLIRQGLAAIALNQLPDLIIASNRTLAEFARRDALVNLEPLMYEPKLGLPQNEREDFVPGIFDAGRFADAKNQLSALPFDTQTIVLYYNADILQAAKNIAPPRTWEQFESAVRAATKDNVRGWAMTPNAAALCAIVLSRGGATLNETQTQAQLNDAAWLKSTQLIATLTRSGAAYLVDAEIARNDFAQGKTAFWIGATDDLQSISDAAERANRGTAWRVTNLPQIDSARPMSAMLGEQIAVFKSTDERARAAWVLMRWLVAAEQNVRWARVTFALPARVSVPALLADNPSPQLARMREGMNPLPIPRTLPNVKDALSVDAAMVDVWTSVIDGADPATVLKNANARINRVLGQIQ